MKPSKPREWTKEEIAMLGKETDLSLARRLSRSISDVRNQRWSRKIRPWLPPQRVGAEPYMREKVVLRYGPYTPPVADRQDKLRCVGRGWVQVGDYSQAPIPWPMRKGTRSLILCGDLVTAVRQESALAIAHHWGVCPAIVSQWRRVLGVPSITLGTQRLKSFGTSNAMTRAVREHIAEEKKGKPTKFGPGGKERLLKVLHRPRSAQWRRKMAPHFAALCGKVVNPKTRLWTAEEDKLLGAYDDAQVAKMIHRTESAVKARRYVKCIPHPNPAKRPWTKAELQLLPQYSPQEVAKRTGHPLLSVRRKRRQLGIFCWHHYRPWTPEDESLLGTMSDERLAQKLGRSRRNVYLRRAALGIKPSRKHANYEYWTTEEDKLLGTASDKAISGNLGRTKGAVQRRRFALGLASHRYQRRITYKRKSAT